MNISNGYTQIETWEEERLTSAKRRGLVPRNTRFPYDLGLYTNLCNALGPVYTWLLPWGKPYTIIERSQVSNKAATENPGNSDTPRYVVVYERNESGYDDEGNPLPWPPDVKTVDPPPDYFNRSEQECEGIINSALNEGIHRRSRSQEHRDHDTEGETNESVSIPMTFAQTAYLQNNQHSRNDDPSSMRRYQDPPTYSSVVHGSRNVDNAINQTPSWRRNLRSDNDFYSRELWSTFDGEKLSDYGVDLDSEMDLSVYTMNQQNLPSSDCFSSRSAYYPTHFSLNQINDGTFGENSITPSSSNNNGRAGVSSSTSLSRSSSPLLRHSTLTINNAQDNNLNSNNSNESVSSKSLPTSSAHSNSTASSSTLDDNTSIYSTTTPDPDSTTYGSNEDDLPLAKILALRQQEKIKLQMS